MLRSVLALALAATFSTPALALTAGDIAVIAFNTDGKDDFAWVALTDIGANTAIHFTDSSWEVDAFRTNEHLNVNGPLSWTHGSAISAGTIIRYSGNTDGSANTAGTWTVGTASGSDLVLSTNGDQIFAFQGAVAAPTFLYGLQFSRADGIIAAPTVSRSVSTTNVPDGLSLAGGTMVDLGNFDNGYYSGPVAGTQSELLAAMAYQPNWTLNNSVLAQNAWPQGVTVTSAISEADTYAMMLSGLGLVGFMAARRRRG